MLQGLWKSPIALGIPFFRTGKARCQPGTNLQAAVQNALIATPDATTTSLNGTTTLTANSSLTQVFTGTATGHAMVLPDATTLEAGWYYDTWNLSSAAVAIKDAGGNVLGNLRANGHTVVFLRAVPNANGTWVLTFTLDNGNAFGTELSYVEANPETSNNSQTTWANKLTLTTASNTSLGDYLVNFQFMWRSANANRNIQTRIQKGGVDIENWQPFTANLSDRPIVAGFSRVVGMSGANTFTLDFRVGAAGSTTVYISNARMFVWRIS